jgi:hypothetical protein
MCGVAPGFPRAEDRKRKKKKADHLMPQRVNGFDGGWNHVPDEMTCLPRQLLLGHVFMVSKYGLSPPRLACTIKGRCQRNHPGTVGRELASEESGKSHKERGIVWKNVSRA